MARRSWWDEHREQVGEWASGLEIFAGRYVDKNAYLRRVGGYILWCHEHGHDPTEADYDRMTRLARWRLWARRASRRVLPSPALRAR